MKARCLNPHTHWYSRYGGRGITVCERWLHSFENFLADMGERPSRKHTIDRINGDGNYEPKNCHWATQYEQTRPGKRRPNKRLKPLVGSDNAMASINRAIDDVSRSDHSTTTGEIKVGKPQ